MVITLTPATGSATTLIDGPDRAADKTMGPANLDGGLVTPAHMRAPIRRAFGKPIQRGGSSGTIQFTGVRLCATQAAARIWLIGHLAACPKGGTLTLTDTGVVTTLSDAVLTNLGYRWQGVSIHLTYQFAHGEATVAAT